MVSSPSAERPHTDTAAIGPNASTFSWLKNAGIVKLNLILILPLISNYATGFDGSMMNGCSHLIRGLFQQPRLNAIQNVGQLVALPLCAITCDRFGRQPSLIFSACILLVGVILQAAAQNTGMFIAARGILRIGLALNITAAPLLLLEPAYPRQQGPSAAWITYGTFRLNSEWAWRIPSLLQGLSSIIQILLCWLVEESPRWLMSKDRDEEARKLITKYHVNGDDTDAIVNLEMDEIRTALTLETHAHNITSYMSFFQTKGNVHRFFIILCVGFFSQWSGNSLISYYLTLILNSIGYRSQETQTLINALMTLWGMIWGLFFSAFINRFGRRTLFLTSTIGCLCVYVTWTALDATYEKQTALDGEGCYGIAKGVTYVIEILPFNLRARTLVLYNLFVALALIFNQYANIGVILSE
ncbi:putative sugar transporter [Ilyonectria destructans]|nr:putative sugar transporter [Ilyonectria destructans]